MSTTLANDVRNQCSVISDNSGCIRRKGSHTVYYIQLILLSTHQLIQRMPFIDTITQFHLTILFLINAQQKAERCWLMFTECPFCRSDPMHHTLTIFPNTHPYLCHAPAEGGRGLAGTEQWAGGEPSGPFGRPAAWRRSRMEEGGLRSGHTSSTAHPPPQGRAADRKPPVEDRGVGNEKGSSEDGKVRR